MKSLIIAKKQPKPVRGVAQNAAAKHHTPYGLCAVVVVATWSQHATAQHYDAFGVQNSFGFCFRRFGAEPADWLTTQLVALFFLLLLVLVRVISQLVVVHLSSIAMLPRALNLFARIALVSSIALTAAIRLLFVYCCCCSAWDHRRSPNTCLFWVCVICKCCRLILFFALDPKRQYVTIIHPLH